MIYFSIVVTVRALVVLRARERLRRLAAVLHLPARRADPDAAAPPHPGGARRARVVAAVGGRRRARRVDHRQAGKFPPGMSPRRGSVPPSSRASGRYDDARDLLVTDFAKTAAPRTGCRRTPPPSASCEACRPAAAAVPDRQPVQRVRPRLDARAARPVRDRRASTPPQSYGRAPRHDAGRDRRPVRGRARRQRAGRPAGCAPRSTIGTNLAGLAEAIDRRTEFADAAAADPTWCCCVTS